SGEQILHRILGRTSGNPTTGKAQRPSLCVAPPRLHPLPQRFRDDPQVFDVGSEPFGLRTFVWGQFEPGVLLLRFAPHAHTMIELARQYAANSVPSPRRVPSHRSGGTASVAPHLRVSAVSRWPSGPTRCRRA